MKILTVRFRSWPTGRWYASKDDRPDVSPEPPPAEIIGSAIIRQEFDGRSEVRLPKGCPDLDALFEECEQLLVSHYDTSATFEVDPTTGWADEASRLRFVSLVEELETRLSGALGPSWSVVVNPSPGLVEVRLMGEYS